MLSEGFVTVSSPQSTVKNMGPRQVRNLKEKEEKTMWFGVVSMPKFKTVHFDLRRIKFPVMVWYNLIFVVVESLDNEPVQHRDYTSKACDWTK